MSSASGRAAPKAVYERILKSDGPEVAPGACLYGPQAMFQAPNSHRLQSLESIALGDKSYDMSWFSPFSPRASTQGPVPQKWIAQFALYDQINAIVSAPPSPFIPLVLQTPLNNLVVLFTAVIAYFYLKTRFKMVHYAGICIILCSCMVGVIVEPPGRSRADPSTPARDLRALFVGVSRFRWLFLDVLRVT